MNAEEVNAKLDEVSSKDLAEVQKLEAQVSMMSQRLDDLVTNGADQILDEPTNKEKLDKTRKENAEKAPDNDYKANLELKKDYIDQQLGMVSKSNKKAASAAKKQAKADSKLEKRKNEIIKNIRKELKNYGDSEVDKKKQIVKDRCGELREGYVFKPDQAELDAIDAAEQELNEMIDEAAAMMEQITSAVKAEDEEAKEEPEKIKVKTITIKDYNVDEKINKKIAELPKKLMEKIKELEKFIYSLIWGFPDIEETYEEIDLEEKVNDMISKLRSLLDPIFASVNALSLPIPPVLKPITDLLGKLGDMGNTDGMDPDMKALIEEMKKKKPKIPINWKATLISLQQCLMQLVVMFPICLINLIFKMIDAVVGQILALGGAAPYPLSLLPQAIQLMPKLIDFSKAFPESLIKALYKKLEAEVAKMLAMGQSLDFSGLEVPKPKAKAKTVYVVVDKREEQKAEKERKEALKQARRDMKAEEIERQEAANEALIQEFISLANPEPNNTPAIDPEAFSC